MFNNIRVGDKIFVNLDNWIYTPDGKNCKAVFGTFKGVKKFEDVTGIKPTRSTNWFLEIGNMIIAGCQIHYIFKTDYCWNGKYENWSYDNGVYKEYYHLSPVYFADEGNSDEK